MDLLWTDEYSNTPPQQPLLKATMVFPWRLPLTIQSCASVLLLSNLPKPQKLTKNTPKKQNMEFQTLETIKTRLPFRLSLNTK